MSIAPSGNQRAPTFQQLHDYLYQHYGKAGLEFYRKWLLKMSFDETIPLLIQSRKMKSLNKGRDLIKLFQRWKNRKRQEKEVAKQLLEETSDPETRKKILLQLHGGKTLTQAAMECDRKDLKLLAEIAEGRPPPSTHHSGAVNVIEQAMQADLKSDPLALQKLGRKLREGKRR